MSGCFLGGWVVGVFCFRFLLGLFFDYWFECFVGLGVDCLFVLVFDMFVGWLFGCFIYCWMLVNVVWCFVVV